METEKEYQNVNNNEDCIRLFIRCIENEKVDIQGMSVGSQARVLQTVLTYITKQEKMIELMALALAETEFDKCCDYCHTDVCTAHDDVDERAVCIKQYFEKKANEESE